MVSQHSPLGSRIRRYIGRANQPVNQDQVNRDRENRDHKISVLERQVERGDAIMRLVSSKDWIVVHEEIGEIQTIQSKLFHKIDTQPEELKIANAQWCALEALRRRFREIAYKGEQAKLALAKVHATPSEQTDQRTQPV